MCRFEPSGVKRSRSTVSHNKLAQETCTSLRTVSPARRATIECWWRTDPAHDPDGTTTASYPSKEATQLRTTGTASSR